MAALTDYDDASIAKGENISAAEHYTLLVSNEEALRLGAYGTRESGSGHNHGSAGGELLARSLCSVVAGPYSRPGSGLSPTVGVPVYPPTTGVDFAALDNRSNKLLIHAGLYLPGGMSSVRVRLGIRFTGAGSRSFQLRCVLRPLQKIGYLYAGSDYQLLSVATMSTTGANDFINQSFTLAPLSRLGDISQARWYELLVVLISNPTVGSTARLLGFKVDPVLFADQALPNGEGLPRITIDPREIQQGAGITERLFAQARAMLDGAIFAVLGRIPGKSVQWSSPLPLEDKTAPYRVEVAEENAGNGIHQHQGASYYDGSLIAGQVALLCPISDMGDTAGNEMDKSQVVGSPIDPTAGGPTPSSLTKYRARVPVAKGDSKFVLRVAVAPRHDTAVGTLYLLVRSYVILSPSISNGDTDIITGIELGQQNQDFTKTATYWRVQVPTENADIYTPNEARVAVGLLGHWTLSSILPETSRPEEALNYTSLLYRISKAITLTVNPNGRTGDVVFEFAFYLADQSGTYLSGATLQWLAMARPEEA